ncbi:hypothetical protein [Carboxylicivirga marina]|uniref:Transcriptional regulator n=1 Tax=Carboxylicivirga marina TaxID=2800988 RepID=A0ABS1HG70_9BACT|nr:hypothetical protein [Carboxylicivirga marina]MBK3516669.1 hypothetical protein [Carboxylicivirga marina]
MNYIKHQTNIFALMDQVPSLKPYHISLYLVLFRMWNTNRFKNPISISRTETMKLAKIGSSGTYLKALKDLHQHGFIRYDPSFDPTKGSLIHLFTFDTATCSLPVSKMTPSINNINSKQTNTLYKEGNFSSSNSKKANMKNTSSIEHHKSPLQHPPLQHIQIYFHEKGHPEAEAQRFFNYYESNGWLIGGKTPMKDWKAAARNWMLNIKKFEQKANDTRKKQFQEKHRIPNHHKSAGLSVPLRPISPPPSSSNYDEPL